ncbi:MAG TPA: hypothetical protein VG013_18090 [Gemmataceae bacterium]|jgi:hypothetical protein|nr:hypothetical protein [Gemmataceae bacterium]
MRTVRRVCWVLLLVPVVVAGCKQAGPDKDAKVRANLAKLSPEDRKLAEQQKFCAVEDDSRLGEMGTPLKIMVKDQPVFVCCKGCVKQAQEDPEQTLARVKELRAQNKDRPAK